MKTGRPRIFVDEKTGEPIKPGDRKSVPIVGLSLKLPQKTYYTLDEDGKRVFFGPDFDAAKLAFAQWQSHRGTPTLDQIRRLTGPEKRQASYEYWEHHRAHPGMYQYFRIPANDFDLTEYDIFVPEDLFWSRAHDLFYELGAARFADLIRIPDMANLAHIKKPEPPLTLADLWGMFQNRKTEISAQARSDNKRHWETFESAVKVKTTEEITPELISRYNDVIHTAYKKKPYTIAHNFDLVRAVFRHAATKGRDLDRLTKIRELLNGLEYLTKPKFNPKAISPEDFAAWLAACDDKYRAIMLLMLNAAMRPQDVAALRWRDEQGGMVVDLEAGTIVTHRRKLGKVVRCCVLWKRTIDAIKKLSPHDQPTVFVNAIGQPFASGRIIGNHLRALRDDETGLSDSVKIEHIRDGAITAAIEAKVDLLQVKILAGHSVGISDHYLQRGAYMVADACAAIEKHYF